MAIFGYFTDLHITARTPETRTDDYTEAIFEKFFKAIDIFENNGCQNVLCGGDFFDTEKEPYWITNKLVEYFNNKMWARKNWFYSVAGQHDEINHTLKLENTPYQNLVVSGCIIHLGKTPVKFGDEDEEIYVYGSSWGEKVPRILNPDATNILVTHDLLVKEKIWEGQENVKYGVDFLKENKFDFILCGDNHKPFTEHYRGRLLLMGGSLGRLKSDQQDYQPHVYIIDTDKPGDFEKIKVPLKNKRVFAVTEKIKKKANKKELEKFIKTLDKRSSKLNFRDKVTDKKMKIKDPEIVCEIDDVLSGGTK